MARGFDAATEGMLRRPGGPPLPGLLRPVLDWVEDRHLELMAEAGFDDVRRAHNAVFVHLPAEGRRLTDLADRADISKQAMGELVDDLVDKGYLDRTPDPTDGRAKLIVWADRGERAHEATLEVFARIEAELAEAVGHDRFDELRGLLLDVVSHLARGAPDDA
ncbi:MAG: MarR family transcriptional regulator [Actinobacteria bacterium]|nr:MarR family transcriptional regulator [Actinomycetota bacterium]